MNPRIALEVLLKRLEAEVGDISRGDSAAWVGTDEETRLNERAASGMGHIAQAVRMARAALKSGDEDRMVKAALHCKDLERTGRTIAAARAKAKSAEDGKRGGKLRAAKDKEAKAKWWKPYRAECSKLITKRGMSPNAALRTMMNRMKEAGVKVDRRTAKKYLLAE
jgi:hypothetical protein